MQDDFMKENKTMEFEFQEQQRAHSDIAVANNQGQIAHIIGSVHPVDNFI